MTMWLAVIFSALAFVADLTGTWTGTLTPDGRDPSPARLVLRQDGTAVTGTAGGDDQEKFPLRNGRIENGAVTFEVDTPGGAMHFTLTLDGDTLAGAVSRERDGEKQTARLDVKRAK